MAIQKRIYRNPDKDKYNNPYPDRTDDGSLFIDGDHLQLDLIKTPDINNVTIWMERINKDGKSENNSALPYTFSEDDVDTVLYNILVDGSPKEFTYNGGNISTFTLLDEGKVVDYGTIELELTPASHSIIFNMEDFNYGAFWKYGKIEQVGSNNIKDETAYWLEKRITKSGNVVGQIKFISGEGVWINTLDDDNRYLSVQQNADGIDREATIKYTVTFGETIKDQQTIVLHIIQTAYRSVDLTIQEKGEDKFKNMLLPLTVWSNAPFDGYKKWDQLRELNTQSGKLHGNAEYKWHSIDVILDDDDTLKSATLVGNTDNPISFKWLHAKTPNLNKINSSNALGDIVCTIYPKDAELHVAHILTGFDEVTGAFIWGHRAYFIINEYTSAFAMLKNSFRSDNDFAFKESDDEHVVEFKNYIPSITPSFSTDVNSDSEAKEIIINGGHVKQHAYIELTDNWETEKDNDILIQDKKTEIPDIACVPFGYEETYERDYEDFSLQDFQDTALDTNTVYDITFDGDKDPQGDTDNIKIVGTKLGYSADVDPTFYLDDSSDFDEDYQFYTVETRKYSDLTINVNFAGTTKTKVAGVITYSPLMYFLGHAAGYEHSFNTNEIEEKEYNRLSNCIDASRFTLKLKDEPEEEHWGDTFEDVIPKNTALVTTHVSEESTVKYFVKTISDSTSRNPIQMFNLILKCVEFNSVDWDGFKDDDELPVRKYKISIKVDPNGGGTASVKDISNNTDSYVSAEVEAGDTYTLSQVPSKGYKLDYWTDDDGDITITNLSNILAVRHANYTAHYLEVPTFTIRIKVDPNGKGTATLVASEGTLTNNTSTYKEIEVEENNTYSLSDSPIEDYILSYWSNDNDGSTVTSLTDIVATEDVSYTAHFIERTYSISIKVDPNGMGECSVVDDTNAANKVTNTTSTYKSIFVKRSSTYTLSAVDDMAHDDCLCGVMLKRWHDDVNNVDISGDDLINIPVTGNAKYTAYFGMYCNCINDYYEYREVDSENEITIVPPKDIPGRDYIDGRHYVFVIKNNTGGNLKVNFDNYAGTSNVTIPDGKIGEISMLYQGEKDYWVSRSIIIEC